MAKKNKQFTFADQAKEIAKMFPRRETDPIEKRDYKQAMEALMQEQEAARESMGLNQPQEQFKNGGKMMYQVGGNLLDLYNPATMQGLTKQPLLPQATDPNLTFDNPRTNYDNIANATLPITANLETNLTSTPERGPNFFQKNKQYLPSAISGLSNIGGNLLLASMAKRNQPTFKPSMVRPDEINLASAREQARRDAAVTRNINIRNARNLGLGAGATLANVGAINAAISRDLGRTLTGSELSEQQFNVGAANQYGLANQAAVNRAGILNTQLGQQALQDRLGYFSGALGTIPGVMRDVNLINADEETRRMYKNILPLLGRNYGYTGNLFNNMPVSRYVRGQ